MQTLSLYVYFVPNHFIAYSSFSVVSYIFQVKKKPYLQIVILPNFLFQTVFEVFFMNQFISFILLFFGEFVGAYLCRYV